MKQSESCKKLSPVFFKTLMGGLLKGLSFSFLLPLVLLGVGVAPPLDSDSSVSSLLAAWPRPAFLGFRPRLPLALFLEDEVASESLLQSSLSLMSEALACLKRLLLPPRPLPRPEGVGVAFRLLFLPVL